MEGRKVSIKGLNYLRTILVPEQRHSSIDEEAQEIVKADKKMNGLTTSYIIVFILVIGIKSRSPSWLNSRVKHKIKKEKFKISRITYAIHDITSKGL